MFLLILSVILFFVAIGVLGLKIDNSGYDPDVKYKPQKRQLWAFLVFILCLFNFFTVIPANSVGVQYSPFTGVKETTLREGLYVKGFFDKIYVLSAQVQTKRVENIYGQTKDAQYITMILDVKYQVNSVNAFSVFRNFRDLKGVDENLIMPTAQRSIEAVTTKYDIIEILGSKRNDVYKEIESDLRERLSLNGIDLHSVTLIDTDAGDAIETAIQNEAVAKKEVETAEQKRDKAKIEAEERVVRAKADAEAKIIEAEANAKAYEVMNKELTPEALNKMWIEKWNGVLPHYMGGSDGFILSIPQQ